METLGQLVARLREDRNLTQSRLAARADVDIETIGRLEQGRGPGWSRKTARSVFEALAEVEPIAKADADRYFSLTKFNPDDAAIQRAIAEGAIRIGPPPLKAPPLPDDLQDMIGKLIFSFGEPRVRALLRALFSFASVTDAHPAGGIPGAVAIDFEDPESGLRGKKYIPASPPPDSAATTRRRKSG